MVLTFQEYAHSKIIKEILHIIKLNKQLQLSKRQKVEISVNVLRRDPSTVCSFYHPFPIALNNGCLHFRTSNDWMILNSWTIVTFHFSEKEKKKLFYISLKIIFTGPWNTDITVK